MEKEVDDGREKAGQGDLQIGDVEKLGDDKGGRAHYRRHDLPPGRGAGLYGTGKMGAISDTLHQGDGKAAGGDDIGDRRSGNRGHQAGADHGGFGRPAHPAAGQGHGHIDEKTAGAGPDQDGPEKDKQEDIGGHHHQRDAEDPVFTHEKIVDHRKPGTGRTVEYTEKIVGEGGLNQKKTGDEHHGPANGPPRRLQQEKHVDRTGVQVRVGQVPPAENKTVQVPHDVDLNPDGERHQHQVDGEPPIFGVGPFVAPQRPQQKAQHQHKGQMR
jgi:hypothetical protein